MQRIARATRLRPEKVEKYVELHKDVPAAVLDTLRRAHMTNYSIFLGAGLLFAYLEYTGDDLTADTAKIAANPATQAWWELTDPCQQRVDGAPDGSPWLDLPSVFHLP